MIKKLILLSFMPLFLTSCDWEYCDGCGERSRNCKCYQLHDYFCANTLIGTWQIAYNEGYERGLGVMLKQIEFFDGHKCDITYSVGRDTDWYTDTYTYTYTSGYIKFNKGRTTFMFKYRDFTYPTLTVEDSFGRYEWYKRK